MLSNAPPEVQRLFAEMWADMRRIERERSEKEAKTDPKAYRNSLEMETGKGTGYSYYNGPGRTRFCYSRSRNIGGYYLAWVERETGRGKKWLCKRTGFQGFNTKRGAMDHCLWRLREAKKPAGERMSNA